MLKTILKLSGVQKLDISEQQQIKGGEKIHYSFADFCHQDSNAPCSLYNLNNCGPSEVCVFFGFDNNGLCKCPD